MLLPWKRPSAIAGEVAPGNNYLGLFLPYTPLHHLLFAKTGARALVMTSANLSEEPIVIGNAEAVERLEELADCLLVHNREILLRCDDSVVRVSGGARARSPLARICAGAGVSCSEQCLRFWPLAAN